MTAEVIAVDLGQTGLRFRIGGGSARRADTGVRAVVNDARADTLAAELTAVLGADARGARIAVGMSGFATGSPFPQRLADALARATRAARVTIASDTVTSHLGTVGMRPGAVAICGTGAVALGWDGATWRRADGRGYVLGDAGSGYWIGQQGLRLALDHLDGRGGSAALAAASARWGSPEEIYREAYAAPSLPQYVARFAPEVIAAAEDGDAGAEGVLDNAAGEIARTLAAVGVTGGTVGLTGGLMRSETFGARLRRRIRAARIVADPDAALVGARTLATCSHDASEAFGGLVCLSE